MGKMMAGRRGFTIGELVIVFVIVSAMILVSLPIIKRVSARRDKIICANNLRELGLALYIYAREHEGKFPSSLKTLYDERYLSDKKLLDCPSTANIGTVEDPDYFYAPDLSVKDPSDKPLVWGKVRNHSGRGKNVLYLKGTVVWEQKD
jgi:competence protein ComGC